MDGSGVRRCAKFAFANCPLQSSDLDLPGFMMWILQFIDNPSQIDEKLDSVSHAMATLDATNADSKVQKWALQEICHFLFWEKGIFNAAYGIVPCVDADFKELIYDCLHTNASQPGALQDWIDLPRRRAVLESLVTPWKAGTHGLCNVPQYLGTQMFLTDFDPSKEAKAPPTTTEQYWINLLNAAGIGGQPVFVMRARNFKVNQFFSEFEKADVSRWAEAFGVVVDDAIMIWPRENFEGGRQFLRYLNTRLPPIESGHKEREYRFSACSMHVAIDKFGERFFTSLARLDKVLFDYRIFLDADKRNSGSSSSALVFHSDLDH